MVMVLLGLWLAPETSWGRRWEGRERVIEPVSSPRAEEVQSRLAASLFDQIPRAARAAGAVRLTESRQSRCSHPVPNR